MNHPRVLLAHVKNYSPGFWLASLGVVAIAIAVVLLPILRSREVKEIEATVAASSATLVDALNNPSIFEGEPPEARSALEADVKQLSMLHDRLVLAHYYLAHGALLAALDYTDYTSRLGSKLLQIGGAEQEARLATQDYDQAVTVLKASSLANRLASQSAVNEIAPRARDTTDLAYQECQLLGTLMREFSIAQTMALQHLGTLGPDVLAALGALRPELVAATEKTMAQKKRFNPLSH